MLCGRWHQFTDSMYRQLIQLNSTDEAGEFSPAMRDMFLHVVEWFIWNWDETCAMAKDGKLKIIGDAAIKKHQKNLDDSRDSSDVNQAYDRDAALSDKGGLREYLGFLRSATSVSRGIVDQWGTSARHGTFSPLLH